jgi:hypothetical protein
MHLDAMRTTPTIAQQVLRDRGSKLIHTPIHTQIHGPIHGK